MGSSAPKTVSTLTKPQQLTSANLSSFLNPQIGRPATQYGGQLVAPLVPQFGQVQGLLNQYNPAMYNPQMQASLNSLLSGRGQTYSSQVSGFNEADTTRYFQNYVQAPLLHTFDTQIAPRINSAFAGVGAFSSRQGDATASALADLQANLASGLGQQIQSSRAQQNALQANAMLQAQQLTAQSRNLAGQQQLGALGLIPGLSNLPLQGALGFEQALNPYQTQAQNQNQAAYQEFLRTSPEASPWNQLALNYIGQQQLAAYNPQSRAALGTGIGAGLGSLLGLPLFGLGPLGFAAGIGLGGAAGGGIGGSIFG